MFLGEGFPLFFSVCYLPCVDFPKVCNVMLSSLEKETVDTLPETLDLCFLFIVAALA